MKKLTIIILSLILSGCTNQGNKIADDNTLDNGKKLYNSDNLKTYQNNSYNFSIDYPKHWEEFYDTLGLLVIAQDTFEDKRDNYREGFNISVFPLDGLTLKKMVIENKHIAENNYGKNVSIDKIVTNHGLEGYRIEINIVRDSISILSVANFFENKGNLITVTQTSESRKADSYESIFNSIINSLKIKNN